MCPHRRMAPAASAPVVALGEDLLREVFVRLPASADLIRAAAACKPFLRAAARSGPFLRRFRRRHPSSCPRLLGCLVHFPNRRGGRSRLVPLSDHSSSAAAAANNGDFNLAFLPGGGGGGWFAWKHLDSRGGRFLVENQRSHELAVADPISRRYVSLPAVPAGVVAVGYGLFIDDCDPAEFRVVCLSRETAAARELRALVVASGDLSSWVAVAAVECQADLAAGSRAMQANRSLYWRLDGGERMVAFSTASMELSVLDLPPALRELRFDAFDRVGEEEEEDGGSNVLHLLTMTGFRVEVWAGTLDGNGVMAWKRVEKSLRFHKALAETVDPSLESYAMINPSVEAHQDDLEIIGVAGGHVLFRRFTHLFAIDIATMKLKRLPKVDSPGAVIFPYTITWSLSFNADGALPLNAAGEVV